VWLGTRQPSGDGALLITSEPSGAAVEIDGRRWRETTPTAVSSLAPGTHQVRLSAPGHGVAEQRVALARDERAAVAVALPPSERPLAVQSVPSGARVFVDGHPETKRTPLTLSLREDDFHELRLELDGYEPQTRAVKPEDREATVTLQLEPERQERGTLWVDGPATAQVYVDGAPTGSYAPTIGLPIAVGEHAVELHDESGALLAQRTITVGRGEILHVALDPTLHPVAAGPLSRAGAATPRSNPGSPARRPRGGAGRR
jgi:hypothetical protein